MPADANPSGCRRILASVLAVDAVGWFGIALIAAILLVLFISLPVYERVKHRRDEFRRHRQS